MAGSPSSSRARRRWRLLREAIVGHISNPTAAGAAVEGATSTQAQDQQQQPSRATVYTVEGMKDAVLLIPRQERPSSSPLDQLISHRIHDGVDATGQVRIWPAEEALLAWCLQQCPPGYFGGKRVLELGAGMAGLAGLGIACYADPPPAEVILTDGHPGCVAALEACVALNRDRLRCPVRVERLVWGQHDEQAPRAARGSGGDCAPNAVTASFAEAGMVDLVLGADLLFFERFHAALLDLLGGVLRQDQGAAWLLQPSRGGALERFVARAGAAACDGKMGWEMMEEAADLIRERVVEDQKGPLRLLGLRRRPVRSAGGGQQQQLGSWDRG